MSPNPAPLTGSPDSDLEFLRTLDRARAGDGEALGWIVERFLPQVRSRVHGSLEFDLRNSRPWLLARFSTGDIVQEVFHGVLSELGSFRGRSERAFAGYLAMVVRNRIIDAVRFHEAERRDGRRGSPLAEVADHKSATADPAGEVASAEEHAKLNAALAKLPERERLLLRARFEESASFRELCDRLGYSSVSATRRAYFAAQAELALEVDGPTSDRPDARPVSDPHSHSSPPETPSI